MSGERSATDGPRPRERRGWAAALLAFALLIACYGLSVGPAGWLVERGLVPGWLQPVVWFVYVPHRWVCRHWSWYAAFFVRYLDWWI